MIKFVMVHPHIECSSTYVDTIIRRLKSEKSLVKSCFLYEKEDSLHKVVLNTEENAYFIDLDLATYNDSKHLFIDIKSRGDKEDFDKGLYNLKFFIKSLLRKEWQDCIWLEDEQSAQYANELYLEIHTLENDLRQFINIVMIRHVGVSWWDNYTPKKIREKYLSRRVAYKRVAKLYTDVSDELLSIDTEDLLLIMTNKINKFDQNKSASIVGLLESLKETGDLTTVAAGYRRLVHELRANFEVELDLWEEIFSKYFSDNFIKQWETFSKNRNHVAHNKLLDTEAYRIIKTSINDVKSTISKAQIKFETISISDEEKERILELEEERKYELELSELYRKQEESGIRILDDNSILDEFNERVSYFIENVADNLYFRSDLEVNTEALNLATAEEQLLNIYSKLSSNTLSINCTLYISEDTGSQSELKLFLVFNDELIAETRLIYQNGEASLDDEHNHYLPVMQNELYEEESEGLISLNDFETEVETYLSAEFPNLVDEVDAENYSSIKDGGASLVADFPCEECGENYVYVGDVIAEEGQCLNCGHSHSINSCLRCESYYNEGLEGNSTLCEGCLEHLNAQ